MLGHYNLKEGDITIPSLHYEQSDDEILYQCSNGDWYFTSSAGFNKTRFRDSCWGWILR